MKVLPDFGYGIDNFILDDEILKQENKWLALS
jgi:hypothetical protein